MLWPTQGKALPTIAQVQVNVTDQIPSHYPANGQIMDVMFKKQKTFSVFPCYLGRLTGKLKHGNCLLYQSVNSTYIGTIHDGVYDGV